MFDGSNLPGEIEVSGRGGTRYSPVFELLRQDPPSCLIYLTDLYCSDYPTLPPEYPVLWMNTEDVTKTPPPFGEVACMGGRA